MTGRAVERRDTPVASERRDEILAIAGTQFAEKGYASTTVREIADAAGILSGSLYHHFDSKESMVDELLRACLDDILVRYRAAVRHDGDPAEVLRALVREAFSALGPHRDAIAVMVNEYNLLVQLPRFAYLLAGADETERLWVGVLEDGRRRGTFRADVEPRLAYRFMRDAIWISVRWYRPGGPLTPDELADRYLDMLLAGLQKP